MWTTFVACLLAPILLSAPVAQTLIDRVLARVEDYPITLSEAEAATRLGIVDTAGAANPIAAAMQQLIDRRLVLAEVARFAPGEPAPAKVAAERAALEARLGASGLAALERETGTGDVQLREVARDNLRIQAYLAQRFGASAQPTEDEVGEYYRRHLDDFRDAAGQVRPFVEVEGEARIRAARERRETIIAQWLRDLRQRSAVVEFYRPE